METTSGTIEHIIETYRPSKREVRRRFLTAAGIGAASLAATAYSSFSFGNLIEQYGTLREIFSSPDVDFASLLTSAAAMSAGLAFLHVRNAIDLLRMSRVSVTVDTQNREIGYRIGKGNLNVYNYDFIVGVSIEHYRRRRDTGTVSLEIARGEEYGRFEIPLQENCLNLARSLNCIAKLTGPG